MPKKLARNLLDSAVPKSASSCRLREGEKQALELGEYAEHSHGQEREDLQKAAKSVAERGSH